VGAAAGAAVCVVAAAEGYPENPRRGDVIGGLEEAGAVEGVTVLHAGTRRDAEGVLRTDGGRVLAVTAVAATIDAARERAYAAVGKIEIEGVQYRTDIALPERVASAS